MIDVKQLRIGSIVANKHGFQFEVVGIFKDQILCDFKGNEGDVFEFKPSEVFGVPLTEEWLEKFGFEKVNVTDQDSDDIFYLLKGQTDWWIRFWNEYYYFSEEDFGIYDPFKTYSLIGAHQYVHQLQNLVLDLSGTELELKTIQPETRNK